MCSLFSVGTARGDLKLEDGSAHMYPQNHRVRVLQMAKLASALAHLKTKKLRFVVQKAKKMLAAPTGGCKKLRLKRRGGHKVSAQKRKSARFELPWCMCVYVKVQT